jgi:hypothetical protein
MFTEAQKPMLDCVHNYGDRDKECIQYSGGEFSEYVHVEKREECGKQLKVDRREISRL